MSTFSIQNIRDELCHFLRYSDILSTTTRGVTRVAGSYTVAGGGESTHTFVNIPMKNIVSLTVDAAPKYYLRDYTMNWNTGILTWNSALSAGQVVAATYDYGSSDKIFPDFPRDDLKLTSFPRVGIELTSATSQPLGLGGQTHISDFVITIIAWIPANKDTAVSPVGGLTDLNTLMYNIRDKLRTNAKLFYTFPYITPANIGPLIRGTNSKIMQQSSDWRIKFKLE